MIEITIRTIMKLIPMLGGKNKQTFQIEKDVTINDLLISLEKKYGKLISETLIDGESLRSGITMYKNGVSILALNGLNTKLDDGDDLLIFPPVGGG